MRSDSAKTKGRRLSPSPRRLGHIRLLSWSPCFCSRAAGLRADVATSFRWWAAFGSQIPLPSIQTGRDPAGSHRAGRQPRPRVRQRAGRHPHQPAGLRLAGGDRAGQPAAPRAGHRVGVAGRQGLDLHPALRREVLQRVAVHGRRRGLHLRPAARPRGRLAAASGFYANVTGIKALDATHVEFTLKEPNPEFPSDVADYHAAVLSKAIADPAAEWVGTGPFTIESYSAEDRAILKKNPELLDEGRPGQAGFPTLTRSSSSSHPTWPAKWRPCAGTRCSSWPGSPPNWWTPSRPTPSSRSSPGRRAPSTTCIHMRSDAGHPAADPRVRQALQLGTDHQGLIDQVRPGLAVVGNGTPVGPAYGDYYLDQAPVLDLDQAKSCWPRPGSPMVSPSPSMLSRRWRCRPSPPSGRSR